MKTPVDIAHETPIFGSSIMFYEGKQIFRNVNFNAASLDAPCTVIKACIAESKPGPEWEPCDITWLRNSSHLYTQNGVQYYGRL